MEAAAGLYSPFSHVLLAACRGRNPRFGDVKISVANDASLVGWRLATRDARGQLVPGEPNHRGMPGLAWLSAISGG